MSDKDLNKYLIDIFEKHGSLKKFKEGQSLCSFEYIPGNVFLIKKGVARLLAKIKNKITTIDKIGPGELIGALSLLRAEPSEEIRASQELIVWQISDAKFHELFKSDINLRNYLNNYLFTSEVYLLMNEIYKNSKTKTYNLDIGEIHNLKRNIFIIDSSENSIKENLDKNYFIFLNSNLDGVKKYEKIISIFDWERINNRKNLFPPRFISISKNVFNDLTKLDSKINVEKINSKNNIKNIESNFENSKSSLFQTKFTKDFLESGFDENSSIYACLKMLSKILDFPLKIDVVEKILITNFGNKGPKSLLSFAQIITNLGLQVSNVSIEKDNLLRLKSPSIILYEDEIVIIVESNNKGIKIASPRRGFIFLEKSEIKEKFFESINILFVEKNNNTQQNNFDLGWFLPAIAKYKGIFIQIFITGFFIQLFSLANPLLIQVIIDKVITQRSLDTLQILGIALVAIILFEGILSSLKTFLLSETTNRLDQSLGSRVIEHLLKLPLSYFDKRSVGELSSRISELEKIRNFITGTSLTTILDAIFSIIYLIVMIFYSWKLTIISLLVLPLQILITVLGAPLFRRQYRDSAEQNAKTQSHLIEILTGINSVKSQNMETVSKWKWQHLYSKYIKKSFIKTITSTSLQQITKVLQKLSQLLVLWAGAAMVLKAELTLGQLIAFRIISSYVTQPFLRLSTIWQNIQELKISFYRLGDLINTPKESDQINNGDILLPNINGSIKFVNVNFKFPNTNNYVISNFNLNIEPNSFIAVVGRSGSGKSTMLKLLSRLYLPDSGTILIDDLDINKIELNSLRGQIGFVPQESILFSGSIKENISITQPEATMDEIIQAAKIVDAHDFIMSLDKGYSTFVGERGVLLSGGQRQRIALARALIINPRILVMDEATSALDYATEKNVYNNLLKNLKFSTKILITHRISNISKADKIIVMHEGRIEELGSHQELLNLKGRYFSLININKDEFG